MKWMPLALLILIFGLSACDLAGGDVLPTREATQLPANPTATVETPPSVDVTQSPVETPLPVSDSITLTVWTSSEIAPNTEVPGGAVLLEQLNTFDNDHSAISLLVELKTISDQGGILSYLRTGRTVAPSILPDIILLPSSQLRTAATQGLIYPLEDDIAVDAIEDLYPVARTLAEVDGQLYGYPFALTGLQHLVYNSNAITRTVSSNWNNLIEERPGLFLYPAAGASGAELTAQFYQALGGAFSDESGQASLQNDPLVGTLDLMRLGVTQGFIDPQSGGISSNTQLWQIFQDSSAHIVQTSASAYLERRDAEANTNLRVAALPGPSGPLTPTVSAWVWAISTAQPERREAAVELINWLATADNIGNWCLQSHSLPARQSAFDVWPQDAYVAFLQRQLASASPPPAALNNTILTALSDATSGVILGLSTPADAAQQARAALTP